MIGLWPIYSVYEIRSGIVPPEQLGGSIPPFLLMRAGRAGGGTLGDAQGSCVARAGDALGWFWGWGEMPGSDLLCWRTKTVWGSEGQPEVFGMFSYRGWDFGDSPVQGQILDPMIPVGPFQLREMDGNP